MSAGRVHRAHYCQITLESSERASWLTGYCGHSSTVISIYQTTSTNKQQTTHTALLLPSNLTTDLFIHTHN